VCVDRSSILFTSTKQSVSAAAAFTEPYTSMFHCKVTHYKVKTMKHALKYGWRRHPASQAIGYRKDR
jgi:hypothetical protein